MAYDNPADAYWHRNYTVRFVATCTGHEPRYIAEHLPTQHTETARSRVEAVEKILAWAAMQPGPLPTPDAHVIDFVERRKRIQQKAQEILAARVPS